MPYQRCARQMYQAYAAIEMGQRFAPGVVGRLLQSHHDMLR
jgi:hypothetical protein